jgi:hypothetical protein
VSTWTRQDLELVIEALEEFSLQSGNVELGALADRIFLVLRGPGDTFAIVPAEPGGEVAS